MKRNDTLQNRLKSHSTVVLLVGILLTLILFAAALKEEKNSCRLKFDFATDSRVALLKAYLDNQKMDLAIVQRSIEISASRFNGNMFNKLAQPLLDFSGLQGVGWLPMVPADKRAAFESAALREGFNNYQIKERATDGTFRVAGQRNTYYPVYYFAQLQGNEMVAGFDLGSDAVRLEAINAAIKSGSPQVTGRITLLQENGNRHGFIIVLPVHSTSSNIRGCVMGVYRADDVLSGIIATTATAGLDISLSDLSAPPGESELAIHRSRSTPDKSITGLLASLFLPLPENNHPFEFAGRRWNLKMTATSEFMKKNSSVGFLAVLPVGILISLGLSLYLRKREEYLTALMASEVGLLILSRAIEQSPVSILITDTQGIIEFVNPKYTEMSGFSSAELIGHNAEILKTNKAQHNTYEEIWATIASGKAWEGELATERKNGGIFYEHASISALRDSYGAITHYLSIKEDITEKKSVMEQLIHSQKMESIGQLAGGLAHDLNNILSVVNGYATLAQLEMGKEQMQFSYLDEITRATSRAASLTRSLLAYSRRQEMNPQRQNLNLLIETVGSFISRIIHDNITFTLSLATEPLGVNVDTVQIEQVLLNLATNARDAMADGGTFTIATGAGSIDERFIATHGYGTIGRYAIITVTDSGHGMDQETKRKVFDPFFTTKEVGKGTGLGLAMVMGIVKQHGGFIDLQSEPGKGSVFQLFLPLVDSEEIAAEPAEQIYQIEKASGTILVVEDDADTRNALEEFITRAGYTAITAIDGQDAVEKFAARKDEIELVISDVVMPRKSGKAAYDEIRGMSESVKFIFVSGHANNVIWREGGLGADVEVIAKPILPYELLRKIRELIPHTYP